MGARSAVMVGRDAELARLLEAFDRAADGVAQVAVVTGEAGIGKTRLVREFVARLPDDTVVAFGHAVPLTGGSLPYGVVADLLRALVREVHVKVIAEALGPRAVVLSPLVPRLGEGVDTPLDRLDVFAATQDLLADLATDRALVLVIEDLHWADESSLDLAMFWARTLVRGRLLLLVTSRDVGVGATEAERARDLGRLPHATAIGLLPLDAGSVRAQVQQLGGAPTPDEMAAVVRLSEGLPLFVEELVGSRFDERDAIRVDLASRLPELEPSEIAVVQAASLANGNLTAERVGQVTASSHELVSRVFATAERGGLLERSDPWAWTFRHELLRLAVRRTLSDDQRLRGHEAWARTLAEPGRREDLVASADHWAATGHTRRAFEARIRAADAVWDASGSSVVADQWMTALRLIHDHPGLATDAEHGDVLACVALTVQWWGVIGEILEAEAGASFHADLPHHDLVMLLRYLGSIWADDIESVPPEREELQRVIRTWQQHSPSRLGYVTAYNVMRTIWQRGFMEDLDLAVDLMEQQARGTPDFQTRAVAAAHAARYFALCDSGEPRERLEHVLEGAAMGQSLDSLSRAELVLNAAVELMLQGELESARAHCDTALKIVPSVEASSIWVPIANNVVQVSFLLGEWEKVLDIATQGATAPIGRANRNNLDWFASTVGALRGWLAPTSGSKPSWGEALDRLPRELRLVVSALAQKLVDPSSARGLLVEAMDEPGEDSAFDETEAGEPGIAWSLAAELAWRDPDTPDEYVSRVTDGAGAMSDSGGLSDVWKAQVNAHLARAAGEASTSAWRQLIGEWDQMHVPHQAAEARVRLAEDLLRQDGRDEAAEALGIALTAADSLGARLLADEIRTLASRARLKLPGSDPGHGDPGPLTTREHEVLQLLVRGMTNDQIGSALFMSPRTASVHVSHILQKLGAANRTEVAAVAHRRGLVTGEG